MKTEWLFNVYPQSKGKVVVVLWERQAIGDEKDRVQNPFSSGALSLHSIEIIADKTNYVHHVQSAKKILARHSSVKFEDIINSEVSEIDFNDKDMLYSDWEV